jgi:hypothetical protein
MKKSELLGMVVNELKALAKKMKIAVPVGAKKADIIDALLAADKKGKKAALSAKAGKKAVSKTKGRTKKAGAIKTSSASRRAPEGKIPEPSTPVHDWKMPPGTEEPLLAQERVSESKYYTGPASNMTVGEHGELQQTYGEDRIVLLTRDPFVVHAYWEATPPRLDREKAWFGWNSKLCVRIYDITGVQFDGRNAIGYFDQELFERAGNWYFDLGRPSHSFCADLGLLSPEGRFLTLARSNYVTMPRDGVSETIDEEWMLVDEEFWKLYGSQGFHGSSAGMQEKEKMRRRRQRVQAITSPGLFSPGWVKSRRK